MENWLQRLNPLTKIAVFLSLTINLFFIHSYPALGTIFITLILIFYATHTKMGIFKWVILFSLTGLPWLILIFAIAGYEKKGDWIEGAYWGLYHLGIFLLRIKSLLLANIILVKNTSLKDFTKTLRSIKVSERVVLFLSTILRFIPLSLEEGKRIIEIQRCRGFRTKSLANPKNFLPIFIPLFISHLKKAQEMALSLEIRYFSWNKNKTGEHISFLVGDAIGLVLAITLFFIPHI